MQPLEKYKALVPIVHRILLKEWDPVGIKEHPEAQDEYDSFVPGIVALLVNRVPAEAIALHLSRIAVEQMGMAASTEGNLEVARALQTAAERLA